jgi:ABC-type multidrug transport system fused ATPase/permease subunit
VLTQTRVAWSVAAHRERVALAVSVGLGLAERVTLAGAALALAPASRDATSGEGAHLGLAVGLAVASTALYAGRRLLRASARIQIEAELQRRAVRAVLARHPFSPREQGEPDAQTLAIEGAYAGAVLAAEAAPGAASDAAASCVVAAMLVVTQPPRVIVLGVLALAVALCAAAVARRRMQRVEREVLATYEPVIEHLRAAIGGAVEIVTRGASQAHLSATDLAVAAHARAATRADRMGALLGRAPIALGVAAVAVVLLADGTALRALREGASLGAPAWAGSAVAFAAALPAFVGALVATMLVTRGEIAFSPMAAWLQRPSESRASVGKEKKIDATAPIVWSDVHASYPAATREALAGVSFAWSPDKVLLVVGANGAGKSTLLRTLVGLVDVTAGALTIGDATLDREHANQLRASAAYLPQEPWLGDQCSVRQAFQWLERDARDDAITDALRRVGLLDALQDKGSALDVKVSELSAGQRQRVALARVMMRDADLLLLDEPDTNLDARGVELIAELLLARAETSRVAVAAHSPRLIAALSSRAVELSL